MSRTMRRAAASLVAVVAAGALSAAVAAPAQATPKHCAAFLDGEGYLVGPKVEAACRFVEETGGIAAIGQLADAATLLSGSTGTLVGPSWWSPGSGEPAGRSG